MTPAWYALIPTWLAQRSGSSKKHKDPMRPRAELILAQRDLIADARRSLELADALSWLITCAEHEENG